MSNDITTCICTHTLTVGGVRGAWSKLRRRVASTLTSSCRKRRHNGRGRKRSIRLVQRQTFYSRISRNSSRIDAGVWHSPRVCLQSTWGHAHQILRYLSVLWVTWQHRGIHKQERACVLPLAFMVLIRALSKEVTAWFRRAVCIWFNKFWVSGRGGCGPSDGEVTRVRGSRRFGVEVLQGGARVGASYVGAREMRHWDWAWVRRVIVGVCRSLSGCVVKHAVFQSTSTGIAQRVLAREHRGVGAIRRFSHGLWSYVIERTIRSFGLMSLRGPNPTAVFQVRMRSEHLLDGTSERVRFLGRWRWVAHAPRSRLGRREGGGVFSMGFYSRMKRRYGERAGASVVTWRNVIGASDRRRMTINTGCRIEIYTGKQKSVLRLMFNHSIECL